MQGVPVKARRSLSVALVLAGAVGLTVAGGSGAFAGYCNAMRGGTSSFVYIKDWNDGCGTVGARHSYNPGGGVLAYTGWVNDAEYAATPQRPVVQTAYYDQSRPNGEY